MLVVTPCICFVVLGKEEFPNLDAVCSLLIVPIKGESPVQIDPDSICLHELSFAVWSGFFR